MTETQPTAAAGASTLAPYLPQLVIEWAREHADERFRELDGSLVSVDISGFTSLSERLAAKGRLGAEELILLLSGVFEGLIGVAYRFGGDVLKFRGDALLLLFAGDRHEERACAAASGMQWFIETTGSTMSSVGPVELRMSTGIYSGACQFFLVDSSHKELVVSGPAATATFELEDASEAGEILVSARTAEALDRSWLDTQRDGAFLLSRHEAQLEVEGASDNLLLPPAGAELEDYVPVPLRAHLAVASGEAEHRQVTVAFVKFSDTDAIFEREGSDVLASKLQALSEVVAEACSSFGVTWLESDIDRDAGKFYLTAGAPSSTGADEEAMLRALRAILDAGEGPPVRAGVNRGHVFAGDIGATARRTYAVMGDAVNLAARLCGRAGSGQIFATGDVLERSRARFESEGQSFRVKGKALPVTAYAVGELSGVRDEDTTAVLSLVGREHELRALRQAADATRTGQGTVVELIGEPGIGKSRLVEELRTVAVGFDQLEARCERYAQSTPFFVWRQVLRRLAGIAFDAPRDAAGVQLSAWVERIMPDLAPWLPLIAIPLDVEVAPTPEAESIDEAFRFERLNDVVVRFLGRTLTTATLVVFEDVHWIDDASRYLLRRVAGGVRERPWFICVTRRPEGEDAFPEGSGVLRLALQPLEPQEAARLALAASEEQALSDDALSTLAERSGGNPLFVRELIAASRQGELKGLPETVETLMTTRIDTLPPAERILLRYASVVGPRFDLSLLGEILAKEVDDADELSRWERLGDFVVWEGAETLAFRHDLFRATAYEGLSFRRRREIHGRVGEALERRAGDRVDDATAVLSLHFLEAHRYDKAWHYSVAAADEAQAKYANVVAGELYERALTAAQSLALPAVDVARAGEALGDVAEHFGDYEKAGRAYAEARALVPEDGEAQVRLMMKEGIVRERSAEYDEALAWYKDALERLEEFELTGVAETGLRAQLEVAYAGVRHRQGQFEDTVEWAQRAVQHAGAAGDKRELAHAYYLLDVAHTRLGRSDPSFRERALPMLEEVGDLIGLATALNNVGVDAYYDGRWEEAVAAYRRSRELSRQAGDVVSAARASNNEAEILSDQGKLAEAQERFEDALRVFRAAQYPWGIAVATSNLARVAARTGRFEDAHPLFEHACAAFERIGADAWIQETKFRIAECLLLEGRHGEGGNLAAETLAAVRNDEPSVLAVALERLLGYAAIQGGKPAESSAHLRRSLDQARALGAEYEAALTVKAIADTGASYEGDAEAEYREIFGRLGVASAPSPPLP